MCCRFGASYENKFLFLTCGVTFLSCSGMFAYSKKHNPVAANIRSFPMLDKTISTTLRMTKETTAQTMMYPTGRLEVSSLDLNHFLVAMIVLLLLLTCIQALQMFAINSMKGDVFKLKQSTSDWADQRCVFLEEKDAKGRKVLVVKSVK